MPPGSRSTARSSNSGQRCTAVKRIIAVAEVADELAARIAARRRGCCAAATRSTSDTDIGTVIDEPAARLIEARVRGRRRRGCPSC